MATDFGPSALATPANGITVGRLLAAPVFMLVVLHYQTSWIAVAAWAVLAGTDGLDGWLARRHGTTRSGAFLDPLADKFLVLGALCALVAVGRFWWFPVALIAAREIAISLYRWWGARQGVCVPARPLAKVKTLVQDLAVGAALLPLTGHRHHPDLADTALWLAVGLTLVSGAQYLFDGRRSRVTGEQVVDAAVLDTAVLDAAGLDATLVDGLAGEASTRAAPGRLTRPANPAGA
jgi:CDP-diacylglycerol--glycerol-3-phosphate 3-phosphatidyltransferase